MWEPCWYIDRVKLGIFLKILLPQTGITLRNAHHKKVNCDYSELYHLALERISLQDSVVSNKNKKRNKIDSLPGVLITYIKFSLLFVGMKW